MPLEAANHKPAPAADVDLRVSLDSGATLSFKLPSQIDVWRRLEADPKYKGRIRAISLLRDGAQHVLPLPTAFRRVMHTSELGLGRDGAPASIRVGYVADDIMVSMTLYLKGAPAMVRFDVRRTGKLRWKAEE